MISNPPTQKRLSAGHVARLAAAILFVTLSAFAQSPCDNESIVFYGSSANPIRTDSNHIETYGQSWVSGDVLGLWTPYEEAWQRLNGSNITSGSTGDANPGSTATTTWTTNLDSAGPGSYSDYSYHWFVPASSCYDASTDYLGYTAGIALIIARPTISGVAAFWWLGSNVLSDNGYYAYSLLSTNANGASGSPYWSVSTVNGGGSVSLHCSVCTSNTITSTAPSNGCVYDVTITTNYGGFNSNPFRVAVIAPSTLTLLPGYPTDQNNGDGFISTYAWGLTDTCGYQDPGLDANEVFGSWVNDTANNWNKPTGVASYSSTYEWQDQIGISNCGGGCSPVWTNPQTPLSSTAVMHAPWTFYVGTQTFGNGVSVLSNTTQFYLDHGRHQ